MGGDLEIGEDRAAGHQHLTVGLVEEQFLALVLEAQQERISLTRHRPGECTPPRRGRPCEAGKRGERVLRTTGLIRGDGNLWRVDHVRLRGSWR
jgi:hypothetical protein